MQIVISSARRTRHNKAARVMRDHESHTVPRAADAASIPAESTRPERCVCAIAQDPRPQSFVHLSVSEPFPSLHSTDANTRHARTIPLIAIPVVLATLKSTFVCMPLRPGPQFADKKSPGSGDRSRGFGIHAPNATIVEGRSSRNPCRSRACRSRRPIGRVIRK